MIRRSMAVVGLLTVLGAGSVHAEALLTAFAGAAFSGATDRSRATYGAALGFLGGGVFGFEAEFSTTPDFFGRTGQSDVFTKNDVVTLMGSLLVAVPGPVRVYGAAGAGLMKARVESTDQFFHVDSSDFGVNVGGGVIAYLGEHVGLRGDVRYFRDLSDVNPDGDFQLQFGSKLDYWRAVGGITFKF